MSSHWNQKGSTISKRNWNQKYCHWFLFVFFSLSRSLFLLLECCGVCFLLLFFSWFQKASIWLGFRIVFASVSFVLLCTDDFFSFHKNLQFRSRTLINCSVTSFVYFILFLYSFNYKSVAVCKINVHDYRTGKNSWVRTVHVKLSF